MNAIEPLEAGLDGSGVRLGFLDTGFLDFNHPAFDRLIAEGRLIAVRDFVGRPQPGYSHGMSVASAAVGYQEGELIAPAHGAEILAAVTEYGPTETNQEEDFFVAGLEWLEAMGADVVNVSLGYTTFDRGEDSYSREDLDGDSGVTTVAVDRAASLGVVVVTSAGNEACASPSACWYYVGTPADGDSVITVGAVTPDSSRSPFSSFGPTADGRIKPDVAAMGSEVYVAVPGGYNHGYGTSFASPLVAAVTCQMLQANPALTPAEVLDILRATASRSSTPNNSLGWGIVNAAAAVEAARRASVPLNTALETTAFPNPATTDLFIHIRAKTGGPLHVVLFDAIGRAVMDSQHYVPPGSSTIKLETRTLSAGVYFFSAAMGLERSSGSFVISR